MERTERYSRKVFVGGLPPDIDEGKNIYKYHKNDKRDNYLNSLFLFYNNLLAQPLESWYCWWFMTNDSVLTG